jgi:Cutinase
VRSRTLLLSLFAIAVLLASPVVAHADLGPRLGGCGDVRFVGVEGSGEGDDSQEPAYGREMATLRDEIGEALPSWADYRTNPIHYPAYSTDLIVHGDIDTYADGIRQGDAALADFMDEVYDVCPDELEILGGYSSGAMVVHDFLDDAAYSDHWTSHIIGVHLLADPRRSPTDPTRRGSANGATWGIAAVGQWASVLDGTELVPSVFTPVTRSWCAARDPVCAADLLDPIAFVRQLVRDRWRHSEYGKSIFPNLFETDATWLTRRVRFRFPPTAQFLDTVADDWPVNKDLKGSFPYAVRFTGMSPAIPNLTLTPDGHLKGANVPIGNYHSTVTAVTPDGGSTEFDIYLGVVEPFDMVPFDLDPVALPPLPVHQPTGIALPGIPARSVVTLEPGDTLPAGLTLSSAGRLQGRADIVGDSEVGVRVAKPDGSMRRFILRLMVVNPAKLVSATADGTPGDAGADGGIILDDSRVAFTSVSTNLGVDNPDYNEVVYIKDINSGALDHWAPSPDESVCGIQTDAAKTSLYIITGSTEVVTDDDGNDDYIEHTTIRRLPVAGQAVGGQELAPMVVTTYSGPCGGASVAPATARGTAVLSPYRLDQPGQPFNGGVEQVYLLGSSGFTMVDAPRSDGPAWTPVAMADVRSDGALLVREQRAVNNPNGSQQSETGYFLLAASGTWRRVDLDGSGNATALKAPRFYAGGLVYSTGGTVSFAARAAAVIGDSGRLLFKPIAPADPTPFDSLNISSSRGIQPLTANDYAAGCHTYMRSKPTRAEPTTVFYNNAEIDSCIASAPTDSPSPFSAGGPTNMLVSGPVGEGMSELLVAPVP